MFNIDLYTVALQLLPTFLRSESIIAFVNSLLAPLENKRIETFGSYRTDILERCRYNTQKIVVEAILNKLYPNNTISKIYINSGYDYENVNFYYKESEALPVFFYNELESEAVYFYKESEIGGNDVDFTVYVPTILAAQNNQIKQTVNKYRAAGMRFKIINF